MVAERPKVFTNQGKTVTEAARKKFTPFGDKVAIQVTKPSETTDAGLILPEISQERFTTPIALVIAVGPECKQVREGQFVLVPNSMIVQKVCYDKDDLMVMSEKDVIGVID